MLKSLVKHHFDAKTLEPLEIPRPPDELIVDLTNYTAEADLLLTEIESLKKKDLATFDTKTNIHLEKQNSLLTDCRKTVEVLDVAKNDVHGAKKKAQNTLSGIVRKVAFRNLVSPQRAPSGDKFLAHTGPPVPNANQMHMTKQRVISCPFYISTSPPLMYSPSRKDISLWQLIV